MLLSKCARDCTLSQQSWPPIVEVGANWESLYAEAAEGLAVIQDVGDAVEWANRFIEEIAK